MHRLIANSFPSAAAVTACLCPSHLLDTQDSVRRPNDSLSAGDLSIAISLLLDEDSCTDSVLSCGMNTIRDTTRHYEQLSVGLRAIGKLMLRSPMDTSRSLCIKMASSAGGTICNRACATASTPRRAVRPDPLTSHTHRID